MNKTWIIVDGQTGIGAVLGTLAVPGEAVTALVVGTREAAERASRHVAEVRWIDAGAAPVEAFADAAATAVAAAGPDVVVAPTTPGGRALIGAVVDRLGGTLVSNATAVRPREDAVEVDRTELDGQVIRTVTASTPAGVLVVGEEQEAPALASPGGIEPVEAAPSDVALVATEPAATSGVTTAERVVSVGRGLGSQEALAPVETLAEALDAQIGCSMPVAEDLGWVPQERYVGVSGQQISPKLYLALGISGMPQHLAGIRNAKTVVAVNNDPNAPIFRAADYGIVGDLHEVVPALTAALDDLS